MGNEKGNRYFTDDPGYVEELLVFTKATSFTRSIADAEGLLFQTVAVGLEVFPTVPKG